MIKFHVSEGGFSLIEAVVAIAVLGMGMVTIFTVYHTVIMTQKASQDILEQSLQINSIVNELRTGIPAGLSLEEVRQQTGVIVGRHQGWQAELQMAPEMEGLYEVRLVYQIGSGKKRDFYAKMVYP